MGAAAAVAQLNPANDVHYAISEEAEYRLRLVADASETIALVLGGFDDTRGEVEEERFAAVFHTFAYAIRGAMSDCALVCPRAAK